MQAGTISLTAWVPYVQSRAMDAPSTVRRFARWLEQDRIDVHALYGPSCHQPWRSGETPSGSWPWIRRCGGRAIV